MHESLAESLSRFTPDGTGLDRDALLFAAGQASARRPFHTWGVLVGALAACQLLTLVLLWPESKPPRGLVAARTQSAAQLPNLGPPAEPNDPSSIQALTQGVMNSQDGDLPRETASDSLVTESPPLRASPTSMSITIE
jgi:hypothetical protein